MAEPTHFADRLTAAIVAHRTAAVVGIDPVVEKLPDALRPKDVSLQSAVEAVEYFATRVIERVAPHVPAVKINVGFFEALYDVGVGAYYRLIKAAHARNLLVIGDIKRGDIGSTAQRYALGHVARPPFDDVNVDCLPDAVTLAGYLGRNAVQPFIEHAAATGRGLYVLVRPSDPGADEVHEFGDGRRFYQHMAGLVREWGDAEGCIGACGLSCVGAVVAPKDAESTAALRAAMPRTPFLVPGYGAQGGTADTCRPCFLPDGGGAVVNASRSVIYAFSRPEYAEQFGDDWEAAVEAACKTFAADIAQVAPPRDPR